MGWGDAINPFAIHLGRRDKSRLYVAMEDDLVYKLYICGIIYQVMSRKLVKAENLEGVIQALKDRPLTKDQLEEFYVNTIKGRGDNPIRAIKRSIMDEPMGRQHILLSGYRGCGKTTELNFLSKELEDELLIINFSVSEELDPVTITHIDLYLVLLAKLLEVAESRDIHVDDKLLKSVELWTNAEALKETTTLRGEASVEVGGEASTGIPALLKKVLKIKGVVKAGGEHKKEVTKKIEPTLTELIFNCNALIAEITDKLWRKDKKKGIKGMLVIIEDLDKLDLPIAENLFYNYSSQITQINTNVILTLPISLRYHSNFNTIKNYYHIVVELPMIKVFNKDGSANEIGRGILKKILAERMDLDLFEEGLIESFLVKSGGCIRDLFRMILIAAFKTLDYEKPKIDRTDYCKAYWRLRNEYENSIAEKRTATETITYKEFIDSLVDTYKSRDKKPDNSNAVLNLRQNLCILSYNDTQWFDVHPVIKDFLIDKGRITVEGNDPHRC